MEGEYANDTLSKVSVLLNDYPSSLLNFAVICCILFIIIGVPGNLLTICALTRYRKIRTATTTFIVSLSVSDLLFCCINLPLSASMFYHRGWIHGEILCVLFPLLRYELVAVSLFSVMLISINRYVLISHPRLYPKFFTHLMLAFFVGFTWVVPFILLLPPLLGIWGKFGLDKRIGSCSILQDDNKNSPKTLFFGVAFVLPCVIIIACYARIFYIARKTARKSRRKPTPYSTSSGASTGVTTVEVIRLANHPETSTTTELTQVVKQPNDSSNARMTENRSSVGSNFQNAVACRKSRLPAVLMQHRLSSSDQRLLKMILVIFLAFVMCYLPITLVKAFGRESDPVFNVLGYVLIYLSSCINPLIYVAMSAEYRQAYTQLLTCYTRKFDLQRSEHKSRSDTNK